MPKDNHRYKRGWFYMPGIVVILISVFISVCSDFVSHILVISWNSYIVNGVSWWVSGGLLEGGAWGHRHEWFISEVTLREERAAAWKWGSGKSKNMLLVSLARRQRWLKPWGLTYSWFKVSGRNPWVWMVGNLWKNLEWTNKITEWT